MLCAVRAVRFKSSHSDTSPRSAVGCMLWQEWSQHQQACRARLVAYLVSRSNDTTVVYFAELTNISHGSSVCMTEYLIAARAVIILWTNLAVMPVEIDFDAIEAKLERRGVEP